MTAALSREQKLVYCHEDPRWTKHVAAMAAILDALEEGKVAA